MSGYIDLHCHPIPGVDDGSPSADDGARLLAGLRALGFARVIATPHVRCPTWDNTLDKVRPGLEALRAALHALEATGTNVPVLELGAENTFDDVVWERISSDQGMLHPGGKAVLIELPYDSLPLRVEVRLFKIARKGITPILAHPERCSPLQKDRERLLDIVGSGVKPLLDLMSLIGAYGTRAQRAAEEMLEDGIYVAACSDAHKPADLEGVRNAIERLERLVGPAQLSEMLSAAPARLLQERKS